MSSISTEKLHHAPQTPLYQTSSDSISTAVTLKTKVAEGGAFHLLSGHKGQIRVGVLQDSIGVGDFSCQRWTWLKVGILESVVVNDGKHNRDESYVSLTPLTETLCPLESCNMRSKPMLAGQVSWCDAFESIFIYKSKCNLIVPHLPQEMNIEMCPQVTKYRFLRRHATSIRFVFWVCSCICITLR